MNQRANMREKYCNDTAIGCLKKNYLYSPADARNANF